MYCNQCGKELVKNEKFCPNCGNKLDPANIAKFCPNCGNALS